jgi:hypothetical protein
LRSYVGTKAAIDDYLMEVKSTIRMISDYENDSVQQKSDLFTEVSQSFGHTALLLHGN